MSGSQPATVGELHPLHRNALRHPLILDGFVPPPPVGVGETVLARSIQFSKNPRVLIALLLRNSAPGEPYNPTDCARRCQSLKTIFSRGVSSRRDIAHTIAAQKQRGIASPKEMWPGRATFGIREYMSPARSCQLCPRARQHRQLDKSRFATRGLSRGRRGGFPGALT